VTGKPDAAEQARAKLGSENVFPKLFDIDELVARLRVVTSVAPAGVSTGKELR